MLLNFNFNARYFKFYFLECFLTNCKNYLPRHINAFFCYVSVKNSNEANSEFSANEREQSMVSKVVSYLLSKILLVLLKFKLVHFSHLCFFTGSDFHSLVEFKVLFCFYILWYFSFFLDFSCFAGKYFFLIVLHIS